jgi:hypothetical protein
MELTSLLPPLVEELHLDYFGVADFTPATVQDFIRSTAALYTLG